MLNPDETTTHEEIAEFLASLKKLRDGLDNFNCEIAAVDGAVMRLGLLCDETADLCLPGTGSMAQSFSDLATTLRSFGVTIREALPCFLAAADGVARGMRMLEIESRKGKH